MRRVVRAVVAPLVFLLLLAAVLAGQVESLISDARELDRSDYVLARVYELQGAVVSRESDLRGWLLRKDARDVAAYENRRQRIWRELGRAGPCQRQR